MELKRNFKVLDPEKLRKEPNIFIQCTHCGKYIELPITQSQIDDWHKKNTFIQDEFPELTPAQREMLLSGICENCWNELFKEEDEM